jgi:4'-phosphopantetheinyl transferase
MPIFFQHRSVDSQILVWKVEEPIDFFQRPLPAFDDRSLPTHPLKRLQFLAGRYLLTQLHPDFPIDRIQVAQTGRPYVDPPTTQFSISHAGSYIAAMIHPHSPVGIDVEPIANRASRVRHKFLHEREFHLLRALPSVGHSPDELNCTMGWTIKEAVFKAHQSTGVDFIKDLPIEQVDFIQEGWSVQVGGKGRGMSVQVRIIGPLCMAWAVGEQPGKDRL